MAARRVKKPKVAATSQALEQLVSQFSQPLAFLRELVQNSLDASTELIEVEVDYDSEAECCSVRVRDTGIGMDRNIIETKLTRLFSSTKEDDLTKIGKFGIGFVSIFAIQPKLVVLETGREGESWRILFKPDRSFELRELKAPVEGTSVTVFTPRPRSGLRQLQTDCRDTVAFWCRHSDVEIQFNGETINQPFDLPGAEFTYRRAVQGTEVVVAPTHDSVGFQGYYNRGLTLLEGKGSPLPHLSFKLRSRYLEHTLSRDNILYDEHYERAMGEVKRAAYEEMPVALLERLAVEDRPQLWALARVVAKFPDPAKQAFYNVAIFPSNGSTLRLGQLPNPVYAHPQVDDFWRAVESTGLLVVRSDGADGQAGLLEDLGIEMVRLASTFLHFAACSEVSDQEKALLDAVGSWDRSLRKLVLVEGLHRPGLWRDRFCGCMNIASGVAMDPCPEAPRWGDSYGVFRDHPFWAKLLALHAAQPELAISLAVRKISLEMGLGTEGEGKLFGRLARSLRQRSAAL